MNIWLITNNKSGTHDRSKKRNRRVDYFVSKLKSSTGYCLAIHKIRVLRMAKFPVCLIKWAIL